MLSLGHLAIGVFHHDDGAVAQQIREFLAMEALMEHFQTEHMDEFLQALPNVVSGEIITRRYAVQTIEEDQEEAAPPPPASPSPWGETS